MENTTKNRYLGLAQLTIEGKPTEFDNGRTDEDRARDEAEK